MDLEVYRQAIKFGNKLNEYDRERRDRTDNMTRGDRPFEGDFTKFEIIIRENNMISLNLNPEYPEYKVHLMGLLMGLLMGYAVPILHQDQRTDLSIFDPEKSDRYA